MKAEVDEFGVLCVRHPEGRSWVEAFVAIDDPSYRNPPRLAIGIDAEAATPGMVTDSVAAVYGLYEWATKGGTAEWLKSARTKS